MSGQNPEPERESKVKKFLNWVNADDGLPNLEDMDDDQDDFLDHHDDHSEAEEDYKPVSVPKVDSDEPTEDYEGDDEFDYPDEMLYEEIRVAGDTTNYAEVRSQRDGVHMTKKQKKQMGRFRVFYLALSAIVALNVIVVLLVTVNYLPPFGSEDNPAVNEVYTRYVESGLEETGAPNIVSAILFSYRSFDTLGEAVVLFAAAIGVILLMRNPKEEE